MTPPLRLLGAAMLMLSACGPKKSVEPTVALEGWHPVMKVDPSTKAEVSVGDCFYPVNYEVLGTGDRRIARQAAMEAMISQWRGERDDGVSFSSESIETLETVLLGKPELIEQVTRDNLQQCLAARDSGANGSWSSWMRGLPPLLTVGECHTPPLKYTLFDYLDVGRDWQIPAPVCAGDRVSITASEMDYYRVSDAGPWINAAGDASQPAPSMQYPCNWEGCYVGQLLMRFTSEDGATEVVPVGLSKVWQAPGHGKIEVMINETTYFDNVFKKEGSLVHHTAITYAPAP
ncbi:MAG: hypothetical protein JXX28_08430 [Deltaproteobacteria bacterium]|nr:hypothetical protein [Deltaproteobacteria bacterium]